MSIFHPHIPWTGSQLSAHTLVVLSDSGKRAANSLNETGMNFILISDLEAHGGSMTILQLARESHCEIGELKKRLQLLKKAGYVRFQGENMELEGVSNGDGS